MKVADNCKLIKRVYDAPKTFEEKVLKQFLPFKISISVVVQNRTFEVPKIYQNPFKVLQF